MARTKTVVSDFNSRYVQGGTTDIYANRVGWFERRMFEYNDSDIKVIITPKEQYRPDLLSYRIYNRANLSWLVLQYNNIVDIQTEFITGVELRLPEQRRVSLDIMTRSPGGNRI